MDAYDIFKKLTKGTKFTKKHNPKLSQQHKQELMLEDPVKVKSELDESVNLNETGTNHTSHNSITLLSSLGKIEEKRGKKRKHVSVGDTARKKRLMEQEEVNRYRNLHNINVVGKHVPEPCRSFEDFNVDKDVLVNLQKCDYEDPTPIQKQAVPILLQGRQLLACAPTGSGKTAAFLVPIIQHLEGPRKLGFRALILCPTRELASQTKREFLRLSEGRGFRVHVISKIKKAMEQYGPKSSQKFDVLITTPNRLCFLLKQDPPAIQLSHVQWLIIDETDKLFEEGNRGFREQLDQVLAACDNRERKIAMFSATYTPVVAKWCVRNMKGLIRITVGHRNAAASSVDQELLFVGNEQGKLLAFRDLVRKGLSPPVLVFVQSKERAQQLFNELIYDGINVDAIHADRTQTQVGLNSSLTIGMSVMRDNTVRCFREGRIWVLICTELMARGVDFKGVNLVVNYDFPPSAISYVHRIGRAGRAGRKGRAVTFFTQEDTVNLRSIAHVLKESGCEVPPYMLTMKKRPKKEKKHLEKSAPKREDIITKPLYERIKGGKRRKCQHIQKFMPKKDFSKNKDTDRTEKKSKLVNVKKTKKDTESKNKTSNTVGKKKSVGLKTSKSKVNKSKRTK